ADSNPLRFRKIVQSNPSGGLTWNRVSTPVGAVVDNMDCSQTLFIGEQAMMSLGLDKIGAKKVFLSQMFAMQSISGAAAAAMEAILSKLPGLPVLNSVKRCSEC